jgi:hypothetical protein
MITADSYEAVRKKRPELQLPPWRMLRKSHKKRAKKMDARELVARRTARMLSREGEARDLVRGGYLVNGHDFIAAIF